MVGDERAVSGRRVSVEFRISCGRQRSSKVDGIAMIAELEHWVGEYTHNITVRTNRMSRTAPCSSKNQSFA